MQVSQPVLSCHTANQPEANDNALWPTCMGSREPPAEQESTSVTHIYRGNLTSEQLWPLRIKQSMLTSRASQRASHSRHGKQHTATQRNYC